MNRPWRGDRALGKLRGAVTSRQESDTGVAAGTCGVLGPEMCFLG